MKRLYSDNAGEAQAQAQSSASLVAGSKPKTKRVRRSVPKEKSQDMSTPGRRSSIYRGVTRHRWTGRYEAHLWDKNCWNQAQNKKGRQVYLGAYDDEEAAAHTYDLAALKYWGTETILNFPLNTYAKELDEMLSVSKEEYLASLRRRSSGFSRGVSKYRGVARHHHNGRWEARIGRVFGNKYLYLGTYSTQEEAAAAYDMAAIEYRGLNAVTNFDLSRYIRWLRPGQINGASSEESGSSPASASNLQTENAASTQHAEAQDNNNNQNNNLYKMQPSWKTTAAPQISYDEMQIIASQQPPRINTNGSSAPSALGILLQSTKFKEMVEKTSVNNSTRSIAGHCEADLSQSCDTLDTCFSDDIDIFDFDSSGHNNILLENIHLDQADNIMSQLNGVDSPHDHLNNITQNNVFQGVQAAAADDHFLQLHHDHQMPLELHEIYSGELLGLDQQDDIDEYSLIDPMSTINPSISFPFAIRTCS